MTLFPSGRLRLAEIKPLTQGTYIKLSEEKSIFAIAEQHVVQKYYKIYPHKYFKSSPKILQKYWAKVLQKHSKSAPKVLQKCPKSTSKVPQKYSKSALKVLHKCPRSTPKVSQKCSKSTPLILESLDLVLLELYTMT